jgi:hypothetical protein
LCLVLLSIIFCSTTVGSDAAVVTCAQFIACLKTEVERFESSSVLREGISTQDCRYLMDGWREKLKRAGGGEQRWGVFAAVKPLRGEE